MREHIKLPPDNKTPIYVFDLVELERRIEYLRERLPKDTGFCYAVKANTFILEKISCLVDRLEICSPGEYQIARKLCLPPEQFVISGVNKDREFLENIISSADPPGHYTVESREQFNMIHNISLNSGKKADVLLRLTSGNQFGMDEYEIYDIIDNFRNDRYVKIKGIQYFSGTQKNSLKKIGRELDYIDEFIEKTNEKYKFEFEEVEFGPGLPVAYFNEEQYDEDAFLDAFSVLLDKMKFNGKKILELGRSIAASCGTYFTRVIDIKCNHGENYAIVDGGMHQLVYYGQFMSMKHPKFYHIPEKEGEVKEWNICGSLCTINDILVKKLPLKKLERKDMLAFQNTGAYCMTEGISLFLSRDLPQIVLFDGIKYSTVRERLDTFSINTPNSR